MLKVKSNKLGKTVNILISVFAWFLIWQIAALFINNSVILPGPIPTLLAFFLLFTKKYFWKAILFSLLRIIAGFIIGIILGIALSLICRLLPFLNRFISIGMSVIKSTPVASLIMILWLIFKSGNVPIVIAVLMVMPLVWQNLSDGFDAIDKELDELTRVFCLSKKKRLKLLVFPTLLRYFIPAVLTSVGLAWKAGIAAEIISVVKYSIGKYIYDAKATFESADMLAWTLVVIVISVLFELLVKLLLRKVKGCYGA